MTWYSIGGFVGRTSQVGYFDLDKRASPSSIGRFSRIRAGQFVRQVFVQAGTVENFGPAHLLRLAGLACARVMIGENWPLP